MILITGAAGLLGSYLTPFLIKKGYEIKTQSRIRKTDYIANLSVASETFVMLNDCQPDIIINLASLTSVDACEERPQAAFQSNVQTVENIANWIKFQKKNCYLIHISTDHLYDGLNGDLQEESQINIVNTYALSKYAGELAAQSVESTILRTNFIGKSLVGYRESLTDWVFNSLRRGESIKVLDDVLFTPLSIETLCEFIGVVVQKKYSGTYNLGSKEGLSKAEFDFIFAEYLNLPMTMTRITSNEAIFLRAKRPKNMQMNSSRFESVFSVVLPSLNSEIKRISEEYIND